MSAGLLPEEFRRLRLWGGEACTPGGEPVEARTAEAVLAAGARGFRAGEVYFTAPEKRDLGPVIGKCRVIADSLEELRLADRAAREASGGPEPVGLRLSLDGEGRGLAPDALPALAGELRGLTALTVRGCFVRGDAAGRGVRYIRDCFEAAKRMSAVLPCTAAFLCIVDGETASRRMAEERPEALPELLRTAAAVAAQNRTAFYARLLAT